MAPRLDEHLEALGFDLVDEPAVHLGFEIDDALPNDKRDRPPVVHHHDVRVLLLGIEQRHELLGPRVGILRTGSDLDIDILGDTSVVKRLYVHGLGEVLVPQNFDALGSTAAITARYRGHASRSGYLREPTSGYWPGRCLLDLFSILYHMNRYTT